jgi:hypothetical protein
LEYYVMLRSVLRAKPHLRAWLTRCRHCGIFFLTHLRNAGRRDLRCPFGCRRAHCKQASAQRSAAFYRQPEGKCKKSDLNQRRPRQYCPPKAAPNAARTRPARRRRPRWNLRKVEYVRMVASLIEGRRISRGQVLRMLARKLRHQAHERNVTPMLNLT